MFGDLQKVFKHSLMSQEIHKLLVMCGDDELLAFLPVAAGVYVCMRVCMCGCVGHKSNPYLIMVTG